MALTQAQIDAANAGSIAAANAANAKAGLIPAGSTSSTFINPFPNGAVATPQGTLAPRSSGGSSSVAPAPVAPAPVSPAPAPVSAAPTSVAPAQSAPTIAANTGGGNADGGTIYNGVDMTGQYTGTPNTPYQYKVVSGQVVVVPNAPTPTTPTLTPPAAPPTEDDLFSKYQTQAQGLIDSIQASFDSSIAAINTNAGEEQQNNNALAAANGLLGSSAAMGSSAAIGTKAASDIAGVNAQRATAVAGVLQQLQSLAVTEADTAKTTFDTESQDYLANVEQQKTDASNIIATLGKAEVNWDTFKSTPEYQQVVTMLGGDANYADALYTLSKPAANVDPNLSKIIGNTYYQVTRDPLTNAMTSSSFQLPYGMPPNWVSTKIGTNGQFFQDPNDASNTFTLTTNPFTGGITATGTGAGEQWASEYNQQAGGSTTTPPPNTNTGGGAGDATTTIASILGVQDPTTPLSDVVSSNGLGAIVAALTQNEGGSPQGVVNNPGNVKYTGAAGQTDSGVKATDGGTFASYATPQAGQDAIAQIVQSAASGQSSVYGQNPTLQDFVQKYTNTGSSSSSTTSPSGLDPAEYGKLASVAGFNPTTPGVDQDALKYLQGYLSGTQPTAASLGISTRSGSGGIFDTVSQRAKDVYFKATGQNLPNLSVLSDNLGLVSKNNALLNNLNVQTGTITKNFGLNLSNLTANNVNNAPPAINGLADYLAQAAGSTSVAQYLTQNATLQQEIGGLLSIKNASGVTVADKIAAGDLLPSDLSIDQQKQILDTFYKEARNQQQAIGHANEVLYQQTDPLGLDPQNPVNAPGYQEFTQVGFQNNYDGTWQAPDGSTWSVGADGNPVQQ